jgi:hypothetical protein
MLSDNELSQLYNSKASEVINNSGHVARLRRVYEAGVSEGIRRARRAFDRDEDIARWEAEGGH